MCKYNGQHAFMRCVLSTNRLPIFKHGLYIDLDYVPVKLNDLGYIHDSQQTSMRFKQLMNWTQRQAMLGR